jgi:hypothetical protein
MSKREQLTVPIDAQLRDFLEHQAAREDRTLAAMARHIIAEAARNSSENRNAE